VTPYGAVKTHRVKAPMADRVLDWAAAFNLWNGMSAGTVPEQRRTA